MDARLQLRIQRYGWDLASGHYEPLWSRQLHAAQAAMLELAAVEPGERVLDVASGTGLATFAAAGLVGPAGAVVGVDLSGRMVDAARSLADERGLDHVSFERMDAQDLDLPDAAFDVALCALGLMYVPEPEAAIREMRRVLRPGGRAAMAVWGERRACGWSAVFEIVDAEVESDVCPMFFRLGQQGALERACSDAGFTSIEQRRISTTLEYEDFDEACEAAFVGGPVAMAWSRFDQPMRERARLRYAEAIDEWRDGTGYRIPGEFVIVTGRA